MLILFNINFKYFFCNWRIKKIQFLCNVKQKNGAQKRFKVCSLQIAQSCKKNDRLFLKVETIQKPR